MKKIFAVLVSLGVCLSSVLAMAAAPDFTLSDTHGQTHSLADFGGKHVVLEWFNPDCPYVRKHYDSGNMQALQGKYVEQGVVWLSINSSAQGKQGHYQPGEYNEILSQRDSQATALLLDHDGVAGHTFGAKTTPHMFIIDPKGRIIYSGAIDDNSSANPRDALTADNYVAQALDEALGGDEVSLPKTRSYGCSVKY
ncbi:MAG: peroxiredoxin [Candidatus Omnitrophota bacterium]|jgi:peroxiredoxin